MKPYKPLFESTKKTIEGILSLHSNKINSCSRSKTGKKIGDCIETSEYVSELLNENGIGNKIVDGGYFKIDFPYQGSSYGETDLMDHTWVETKDLIIDYSVEQFSRHLKTKNLSQIISKNESQAKRYYYPNEVEKDEDGNLVSKIRKNGNLFEQFVGAGKNIYTGHGNDHADYVEIFKNPDSDEMREIVEEARGMMTLDGDVFMCHQDYGPDYRQVVIHDGLDALLREKELVGKRDHLIPIQRKGKTNEIMLGENETTARTYLVKAFSKAGEKMPHLEFVLNNIVTEI